MNLAALREGRLNCHGFWANYLRLLLFAAGYRLMNALRKTVLELLPVPLRGYRP